MNALDNIGFFFFSFTIFIEDAKRHVNSCCVKYDIPLIESGAVATTVFLSVNILLHICSGYVYSILKEVTECYDCLDHPKPKKIAVCTVRARPTLPEHCVYWAKVLYKFSFFFTIYSYLFMGVYSLFGCLFCCF
jgi:molybdopterin/thiamine biosynthesis adenylyltransferase